MKNKKRKKYDEKYLKLKEELKKYKRWSLKDPLTALWNRRKLEQDLERYTEIQKRSNVSFTVVLIDIDNFKKYNDKYGHEYGDLILIKTAMVLQACTRKYEKAYRLSGGADEFILILSHTNKPNIVIKRIKKVLLKNNIKCSVGFDRLQENILKIVDKKMYEDKKGKNNGQ